MRLGFLSILNTLDSQVYLLKFDFETVRFSAVA